MAVKDTVALFAASEKRQRQEQEQEQKRACIPECHQSISLTFFRRRAEGLLSIMHVPKTKKAANVDPAYIRRSGIRGLVIL
jgi:hypothetical protein